MGLDMYLHAKRSFSPEQAIPVLDAAGVTFTQLQDIKTKAAASDGWEEAGVYLSMWEHRPAERSKALVVVDAAGLLPFYTEDAPSGSLEEMDGLVEVSIHCAYWRKANAVHAWFVENVQDGIDECQESRPIEGEELAYLRHICLQAVEAFHAGDLDKAASLLPPSPGFFFGPTELDEWWVSGLQRTADQIERVINLAIATPIGNPVTFTYRSSW